MARRFASALDDCLEAMGRGDSIDDCLARYPRRAAALRPHLLLAQRLRLTPHNAPRPGAQAAGWRDFTARAEDIRLGRRAPITISFGWLRPVAIAAAVVLALLGAAGGTVYASQGVLPDSPLYRVKLAGEDIRLWFIFDDVHEAEVLLDQSNQRTEELLEMVRDGKTIHGNVLSALQERNARAVRILEDRPEELALLARAREQAAAQEKLLLSIWGDLAESAQDEYAKAVVTLHNARLRTTGIPGSVMPDDLVAGVIKITGAAEPATEGLWRFGGVEVRLDVRTLGDTDLEEGQSVNVIAAKGANGRLLALNVTVTDRQPPQQDYVVAGAVEEVGEGEVVIGGQRIAITEETLLRLKLLLGERVEVKVEDVGGQAVASAVEKAPAGDPVDQAPTFLAYEGTIEENLSTLRATHGLRVGGQRFLVTPDTEIDARSGPVAEGTRARVEALMDDGDIVARRIVALAADESAPADLVRVEGVFQGEEDGLWTVSGVRLRGPDDVSTPDLGSLVTLDARRDDDDLVADALLASFEPDDGGYVLLRGKIGGIDDDGDAGTWRVGFAPVQVGNRTVVLGEPSEGSRVFVWASLGEADSLQAVYATVLDPPPPGEPESDDAEAPEDEPAPAE